MWVSVVSADNVAEVFDGLARWERSEQWSRKIYSKPANWLSERAWRDAPAEVDGLDIAPTEFSAPQCAACGDSGLQTLAGAPPCPQESLSAMAAWVVRWQTVCGCGAARIGEDQMRECQREAKS